MNKNSNDIFEHKIALVTGGSSGIGLAVSRALAARGAHVWILARDEQRLATALSKIKAEARHDGQEFGALAVDVTDCNAVEHALLQFSSAHAWPDLVINSAGVAHPGYVQELDFEIFRWMMDVNYFGAVYISKAVIPAMIARGSGHLVNISSLAGLLGVYGYSAYGASKFALRGFTDVVRAELKPHGVDVSIVFPPDTDTPQLAYENQYKPAETRALAGNAGLMRPEEVAAAILRGVAHKRYIILPGLESKLIYRLQGVLGNLIYPLMDFFIRRA
jgi:3-dehydrosphinganine reductase